MHVSVANTLLKTVCVGCVCVYLSIIIWQRSLLFLETAKVALRGVVSLVQEAQGV